ncbi:mechanosensitive ion channel domain-containing protein [Pirellulaceae bacterium SH449]
MQSQNSKTLAMRLAWGAAIFVVFAAVPRLIHGQIEFPPGNQPPVPSQGAPQQSEGQPANTLRAPAQQTLESQQPPQQTAGQQTGVPQVNANAAQTPAMNQGASQGGGSTGPFEERPVTEEATITAEAVQAAITQLNASTEIEATLRQQLISAYESLLTEIKDRTEIERFYRELLAAFEAAPNATVEARRRKESPSYTPVFDSAYLPRATIEDLQAYQTELQTLLQAASDRKANVETAIVSRDAKKKEIPKLVSDARAAIAKLTEDINTAVPEGTDPRLREVTRLAQRTRLSKLNERVRRLEQEQRTYDAENELLNLRRENSTADQNHYQGRLREVVAELGQRRESRVIDQKRMAMIFAERADPTLRADAEKVLERCENWLNLIRSSASVQLATDSVQADSKKWDERFRIMSNKISSQNTQQFNFSSIVGFMLRKQRAELPDPAKLRYRLSEYQQQMLAAETLILELDDWKAAMLVDNKLAIPEYEQQLSDRLLDMTVEEQRQLLAAMEKQVVDGYRADVNSHLDNVLTLAESTESHLRQVKEYQEFIDEHVLWIRSCDQFGRADALQVWPSITWLLGIPHWQDVLNSLREDVQKRSWLYLFVAIVATVVVFNLVRLKREYHKQGDLATKPNVTTFVPTLRAIVCVLLLASVFPLALLFLGYRLYQADEADPFSYAVGMGLMVAARYYFPLELLRRICATNGLAEAHFRWPSQATLLLRRNARWLIQIAIPAIGVVAMTTEFGEAKYDTSLGRLAYCVAMIAYSVFLLVVLNPSKGVFSEYLSAHAGGWLDRFRYFWYLVLISAPLALTLLSLVGYHYTAERLSVHLHTTFTALIGILLAYSIIRRWLLLRRRQILLVQARQRIEDATRKETSDSGDEAITIDQELNLAEINAQTMRLVGSTLVFAAVAAVAIIWTSVLPAVGVLNSVPLGWSIEGANPGERIPITLANLVIAIPIALMAAVAAKNLPGLLEIALLQHLPIENAVRYAISTISRYAILILGIVLTFSNLGVRWNSIQWLVAALGVGLGFGLQEIFANFVSGLILLFEQPVRVGDIITVDNTTGTVAKIRIRATTVVNFDRQEFIIPNKDLITGRLLNWTLTDRSSRLVITVGISYKSDPVKACKAIQEICNDHPNVLKDPAPSAFFELMGDSSLTITARMFVGDLSSRLTTQHDVLVAIFERFNREGIEIPFPQRDLHIRSVDHEILDLFEGRHRNSQLAASDEQQTASPKIGQSGTPSDRAF